MGFFGFIKKAIVEQHGPRPEAWKSHPIREGGEPLVPLGPFVEPDAPGFSTRIFQDSIYWGETKSSPYLEPNRKLEGALLTPFVREGVARKLADAAAYLQEKYGKQYALLVWDAYRPLSVQKALYDDLRKQLVDLGFDAEEAERQAQRYVSKPSADATKPSPHTTGGSVDLTIVEFDPEVLDELEVLDTKLLSPDWKEGDAAEMRRMELLRQHSTLLNMGVAFDEVAPETRTDFYERKQAKGTLNPNEREVLKNRRMLCDVTAHAGFTNYPEEIWHFDRGNQFDGARTGDVAIYGAAAFSRDNEAWEEMRVGHYLGSLQFCERPCAGKMPPRVEVLDVAAAAARRAGNLRETRHGKAHCLEADRLQAACKEETFVILES